MVFRQAREIMSHLRSDVKLSPTQILSNVGKRIEDMRGLRQELTVDGQFPQLAMMLSMHASLNPDANLSRLEFEESLAECDPDTPYAYTMGLSPLLPAVLYGRLVSVGNATEKALKYATIVGGGCYELGSQMTGEFVRCLERQCGRRMRRRNGK
eukprot:GHVS01049377.1.p1 GENE.GHVS01049377.1~~GHVS01049377.1.p1  ORF type:complete len:154 (-),score=13.36 GHVS01049377.1:261-722(-)